MTMTSTQGRRVEEVSISVGTATLQADLTFPDRAQAVVVFAHGSGSGRHSPRNRLVASALSDAGLGTLLMDLLTPEEERRDLSSRELRFDIGLLAQRTVGVIDWLRAQPRGTSCVLGAFGASTGAAAALIAAAQRPDAVRAVVSRGGRPDLAGAALQDVQAATLLVVGGDDTPVIGMNRQAMRALAGEAKLEIVPGASHLFEESDALERVAALARDWFLMHLGPGR